MSTNICIVGGTIHSGSKEMRKEQRRLIAIMSESFPNLMKAIIINIQEVQQTPSKMNSKDEKLRQNQTCKRQ